MPVAVHVVEMRDRLHVGDDRPGAGECREGSERQKASYDRGARPRNLEIGQQVLSTSPKPREPPQVGMDRSLSSHTESDSC